MAKVGVILSGCGVMDGSEIHEAVLMLLSLSQRGATYQCMAPDKPAAAINHVTKKDEKEPRNVLAEAARIARGEIVKLSEVKGDQYDAFVLPGGFGAAKNLCTFAKDGPDCELDPEVARVLTEAHQARKPLGFACISPVIAAKVFGSESVKLTIGHDEETAAGMTAMGAEHITCDVKDIVVDETHRIVSTPAYMEAKNLTELHLGIDKLVAQVLEWAEGEELA
ncbi:MAG: isoprenoid biosynthesis glyoxalase ElbB [Planctomycetota bacterium]|nr:isoprenoid biosynthesis glyoxalase ElbB [Planctomycetaceae bacterium]MDQ3331996.1 isoprenoid biosynthesis glyoxalase ElbB [Planctomycetota bacterium]